MKKCVFLMIVAFLFSGAAQAYDESLAKTYEQFFASFEEKQVAKALHLLPPEKVLEAIKKGEGILPGNQPVVPANVLSLSGKQTVREGRF